MQFGKQILLDMLRLGLRDSLCYCSHQRPLYMAYAATQLWGEALNVIYHCLVIFAVWGLPKLQ